MSVRGAHLTGTNSREGYFLSLARLVCLAAAAFFILLCAQRR